MSTPDNDDLSPPEQIAAEFEGGKLDFETAAIKLLSEICIGVWAIAADANVLMEIASGSKGETKH